MKIRLLLLFATCCELAACSGTTVVLVPDAEGKVGRVSVETEGGSTVLTKANESTKAQKKEKPSQPVTLSDVQVKDMFAKTLAKEPAPPLRYRLYFDSGTANLLPESQPTVEKVAAAIQSRKSCDVSVIGHSDTVGDNKVNQPLSLQRAEVVQKSLLAKGISAECMDLRFYGEHDLAVPTPDNVAEAKNRRVEVEIR